MNVKHFISTSKLFQKSHFFTHMYWLWAQQNHIIHHTISSSLDARSKVRTEIQFLKLVLTTIKQNNGRTLSHLASLKFSTGAFGMKSTFRNSNLRRWNRTTAEYRAAWRPRNSRSELLVWNPTLETRFYGNKIEQRPNTEPHGNSEILDRSFR